MFRKFLRDLNGNKHLKINQENTTPLLSGYYFKFEENLSRLNRLIHSFDEKGVPINTSYIDVEKRQLHYYPITIGQYGLAVFHSWLSTRQEVKKQLFLNIADWFQTHAVTTHQAADKVLHIKIRCGKHNPGLFGISEADTVHHQHVSHLVLHALCLPFFYFFVHFL